MVIMGHSMGDDMNARYDLVEAADLIAAVDALEPYTCTKFERSSRCPVFKHFRRLDSHHISENRPISDFLLHTL